MTTYDDFFPFRKIGLHSNPFRVLTPDEWADIAVVPEEIEAAFIRGENLLILGQRGRGKSTLLRTLIRRLEWQHMTTAYERLPFGKWRYDTNFNELDGFAPDEAQRLALWEWPHLIRRVQDGMRLIMGSHRNDRWLFNMCRIPIRVFHLEQQNTRDHLARVLQQRLDYFADGEAKLWFTDDAIDYLWHEYADNLRAIEDVLYDVFQQMDEAQAITPDLILRCRR